MSKRTYFLSLVMLLLFISAFTFGPLNAQNAKSDAPTKTHYFLNKIEIAPQSIQFFNVRHIDSIKTVLKKSTRGIDTTVVLYSSKRDSLISFDQVMDDYFVEPEVRHFKINTPNYLGVEEPAKLLFSADGVSNLIVYRPKDHNPGYINISSELEFTGGKPEVREKMIALINKWNNLPKPVQ